MTDRLPEEDGLAATPSEEMEEKSVGEPADPNSFRLKGEPPRVMRLSRKTLASLGAVAGVGIGGALFWALQPMAPKSQSNLYTSESSNRPEVVTGAPADYGAVPKLGPPLLGDMGRPIVSAQKNGDMVPVPPIGTSPGETQRSPAEEAREKTRQEQDAARSSRLFLASGGVSDAVPAPVSQAVVRASADGAVQAGSTPAAARRAFMKVSDGSTSESSARIMTPSSPNILQAGSVIPAALITGIRSDLPGQVTAQVTQNVYDSPTGRILLIPQGARLIGEYDSEIITGQDRILLTWDRLILPGGRLIKLERQPGTDVAGMAGLSDRIDYHWGQMFRTALISTLLGVGAELGNSSNDQLVRALREGTQDSVNQAGRSLVERQAGIRPTLTIRPGFQLRVLVTRDLILEPLLKDAA